MSCKHAGTQSHTTKYTTWLSVFYIMLHHFNTQSCKHPFRLMTFTFCTHLPLLSPFREQEGGTFQHVSYWQVSICAYSAKNISVLESCVWAWPLPARTAQRHKHRVHSDTRQKCNRGRVVYVRAEEVLNVKWLRAGQQHSSAHHWSLPKGTLNGFVPRCVGGRQNWTFISSVCENQCNSSTLKNIRASVTQLPVLTCTNNAHFWLWK